MAISLNKIYWELIKVRFNPFYEYATFFEDNLKQEQEKVAENYENDIKKLDPSDDQYNDLVDIYSEEYQLTEKFTQNFRSFLLIQIYSNVEVEFVSLCKRVDKIRGHKPPKTGIIGTIIYFFKTWFSKESTVPALPDFRRDVLGSAKKFLKKAGNVNFDSVSQEWEFLMIVRRVRNAFVHSDGIIKDFGSNRIDRALSRLSEAGDSLKLEDDSKNSNWKKVVITSPEMNRLFINKVKDLFDKIIPQIDTTPIP